jgi:hypothetical protein
MLGISLCSALNPAVEANVGQVEISLVSTALLCGAMKGKATCISYQPSEYPASTFWHCMRSQGHMQRFSVIFFDVPVN